MRFSPLLLIAIFCLYMGTLFLVALWAEKRSSQGKTPINHPVVYALSLTIYLTSWTYFGSIGRAATSGMSFLSFYLGMTASVLLWWIVLRRFIRIKDAQRITSIADFISARYDKSRGVAALVTAISLFGIVPYIALQLQAIFFSFQLLMAPAREGVVSLANHQMNDLVVALIMAFTIILGARRLEPTERHPGMVMAVVIESGLKLVAFLVAGLFITFFLIPGNFVDRLSQVSFLGQGNSFTPSYFAQWLSDIILGSVTILLLPRQFHMAVIENSDERHVKTAMWLFPLYALLITFFAFPIAITGMQLGYPLSQADTFILRLPLDYGTPWLVLGIFVGGISAAIGMITVSSMTLSTMVSNHLFLPLIGWSHRLDFLKKHLLKIRWLTIIFLILISYRFQQDVGRSYMLVDIGALAFAAVFQFAPVTLGGLFWRQGNRNGAILGLGAGALIWVYTAFIPALVRTGWMSNTLLEKGPWGMAILRPEHLFGMTGLDPLSQTVFWSLVFNVGCYVLGSLFFTQSEEESRIAETFVGALNVVAAPLRIPLDSHIPLVAKTGIVEKLLEQYFSHEQATEKTQHSLVVAGVDGKEMLTITELAELRQEVERILAGAIGAAEAHKAVLQANIFTPQEITEFSEAYSKILAQLRLPPEELNRKINYFQERETLLTNQAEDLERRIEERTFELETANEALQADIKKEKRSRKLSPILKGDWRTSSTSCRILPLRSIRKEK